MPLYLYRCEYCGETFEKMARFTEADQTQECPYCHSQNTQKQITTFSTTNSTPASFGPSSTGESCGSSGRFT